MGRKLRSNVTADPNVLQTRKPQHNAKVNQLVVDTDRDNVSFLGELVMGRKLKYTDPANPKVLQSKLPNGVLIRQKEVELKASSKFNADRKHHSNELPPFTVGDEVWVTDLKRPAKVVDANPGTHRSYVVDSDGSTVRRNHRARESSVSHQVHILSQPVLS